MMRLLFTGSAARAAGLGVVLMFMACTAAKQPEPRSIPTLSQREVLTPTAAPTVPPPASTAFPTPRPVVTQKAGDKGKPLGPEITYFGITRADGKPIEPISTTDGIPTYRNYVGSGFQIVVEGKPGASGADVGRRIFAHSATDPTLRPDLEIQVDRPLGDGSEVVCDKLRPVIGGVPAINPPSFNETQQVADTLNDLGCRFETFLESESSCTLGPNEDWSFRDSETKMQFCMTVARAWNFPIGDTLVSARLRDSAGNAGPVKRIRINRPKDAPTHKPQPKPTPTSKSLPARE